MQESSSFDNRYLELRIPANMIDADAFQHFCDTFKASGTSEETHVDTDSVTLVAWFSMDDKTPEEIQQQRTQIITALLLLGIDEAVIGLNALDDDWATAWQKHWQGTAIGKRLWVRPSFCDAANESHIDIVLDPGQAFGTGTHPTTRLCLECIESYCDQHAPKSVLDMGAGSGLLAIAAGKLGAQGIVAIDYDPLSIEATTINAEINHVDLLSKLGDTPPTTTFELVVANILAGPLIDMAAGLSACTGRHLILSGLLQTQVDSIIQAYSDKGMKHLQTHSCEEWAAVEFSKAT